jgi:hypothetical protein
MFEVERYFFRPLSEEKQPRAPTLHTADFH